MPDTIFNNYQPKTTFEKALTISTGQSTSPALDLRGTMIVGIIMPPEWTAAKLSFESSNKLDGTYVPVYKDDGTLLVVEADSSRHIVIRPINTASIQFLKLKSVDSAGAPVNQVLDRDLTLCLRTI